MKILRTTFLLIILMSGLKAISFGQGFYDMTSIQTIEISFSQSNWDQLLDNTYATTGDYIMADSVIINGVSFDSVGVKYKGNSSYQANRAKNPFHIELDTYKDQEYQGYTDIKLANGHNDPSFLRDVLSYQIIRQYMDAPLANFANVYVNGSLIGFYSNTESISKKFVKSRFGSKTNTFINCSPPDGAGPQGGDYPNLVYLGQDSTEYYDAYEMKSDAGWQELIDLCDTLKNHTSNIEEMLDVDRALWMLALDNVMVNLDSYIGIFSQNYYLYRDEYGRFLPVIWDLNESFGVFSQTGTINLNNTTSKQQMSHFLHLSDANWPLVSKILSIPEYRRIYVAHMKTILLESFDNDFYYTSGQSLQTVIASAVQADNNKFFTYNQFISNLTTDVTSGGGPMGISAPGIRNLMNARSSYLLAQTDFIYTDPLISNVALSDSTPLVGQSVDITAHVVDATDVFLKYRNLEGAPFATLQMYDDGLHNDGLANDNTYGATLTSIAALTQFYLYAENSNAGKFSPQRAAHEYYSIPTPVGDLVINEFMADNDAIVADPDGEYDDWIELYNNSSSPIDLSGYYLSDDGTDAMKWQFPSGTTIGANGFLIIWADDDLNQTGLHCSFKLSASGESVVLSDTSGNVIDNIDFQSQLTDISYGRYPNGTGSFQTMTPTFNAMNVVSTGIPEDASEEPLLTVFPNPAQQHITLSADVNMSEIMIYNLSGVLQRSVKTDHNKAEIDVSNMTNGMYFIRVCTEDGRAMTEKLVIN